MKGVTGWIVAIAVLCVGMMAAGQPTAFQAQTVLLVVPPTLHNWELVAVLREFVAEGSRIVVTQMGTQTHDDVDGLRERIPEHFLSLILGPSTGPSVEVLPSTDATARTYNKTLVLGAGWYDEYFASSGYSRPTNPSYADELYTFIREFVSGGGVLGAIGSGLYPIIFSSVLPEDAQLPAYPCPDLIDVIIVAGYQPLPMAEIPRIDGTWPSLVTIDIAQIPINGSQVFVTPIPNSWYPLTDEFGELLISDYGHDYSNMITSIENAHFQITYPCVVGIQQVVCEENGFVSVDNPSDGPADLTGWKLQSEDPTTGEVLGSYTFESYTLESGASVLINVGMRSWNPEHLYWTSDNIWSPNGGKVVLIDPEGYRRAEKMCTD